MTEDIKSSFKEAETDDTNKQKLPKSVTVLKETINDNMATVEIEIKSNGGETKRQSADLKKDKDGEWKIINGQDLLPEIKSKAAMVVEKAYSDLINGDYRSYVDAMYFDDKGTDTEVELIKQTSVEALEKTMKTMDEDDKKDFPKSIKILKDEVKGDEATIEVEIITVGGNVQKNTIGLKKDKKGEWKILEPGNMEKAN